MDLLNLQSFSSKLIGHLRSYCTNCGKQSITLTWAVPISFAKSTKRLNCTQLPQGSGNTRLSFWGHDYICTKIGKPNGQKVGSKHRSASSFGQGAPLHAVATALPPAFGPPLGVRSPCMPHETEGTCWGRFLGLTHARDSTTHLSGLVRRPKLWFTSLSLRLAKCRARRFGGGENQVQNRPQKQKASAPKAKQPGLPKFPRYKVQDPHGVKRTSPSPPGFQFCGFL